MRVGYLYTHSAPIEQPTNFDICWAAGIYEGEGSVGGPTNCLQVRVGQKEPWILHKLQHLFGGVVGTEQKNDADFYVWRISGARGRGFIQTIYTLLSPHRQDQAKAQFDWLSRG